MQVLMFDLVPEEAVEVEPSQRGNHGVPQVGVGALKISLHLDLLISELMRGTVPVDCSH